MVVTLTGVETGGARSDIAFVDTVVETDTRTCPKCGREQAAGNEICEVCGVIFAKIPPHAISRDELPDMAPLPGSHAASEASERGTPGAHAPTSRGARLSGAAALSNEAPLSRYDWALLGGGFLAAALAQVFPLTRFLLSMLVTLLHELGHAAVAWVLGCPAVPAFDLMYGGGVTYHQDFEAPLAIFVGVGLAGLGYWLRGRPRAQVALAVVGALWLAVVISDWRRQLAISAAGHAAEMVFAGIFLWMALSGVGWRMPEVERPLGSFIAFFTAFHTLGFASRLRSDEAFLADYMRGKGGALMNDLEHIALDLKIWLDVDTTVPELAGWMLFLTPLPMLLAFCLHALRRPAKDLLVWLFEPRRAG